MRYDLVWRNLVKRALRQSDVDLDAFIDMARDSGMSADAIQDRLLDDLDTGGPIFGKFFRSIEAAAAKSTDAAFNGGSYAGSVFSDKATRAEVEDWLDLEQTEIAIMDGSPEAIEELMEGLAERDERIWVAELTNTCHRCLPLHGTIRTMAEWKALGLEPETIHDGWESPCKCTLHHVASKEEGDRTAQMAPLVRNKLKGVTGVQGNKKTARGVLTADLDRAREARNKAMESLEGRRTLRMLGQSKAIVESED